MSDDPLVIPVIREEVTADAKPVRTGGVRITKTVETHEQLLTQELRKGRADVQRRPMNEVVDGPLEPRREGRTLIIPVVSEQLAANGCGPQWVLTEEIRVTQIEEAETVQHRVPLREEKAIVERVDAAGNTTRVAEPATRVAPTVAARQAPARGSKPVLAKAAEAPDRDVQPGTISRSLVAAKRNKEKVVQRVLSKDRSILRRKVDE